MWQNIDVNINGSCVLVLDSALSRECSLMALMETVFVKGGEFRDKMNN
jgi:hypothetical protein